jgi:hypothetical protein
MSVSTIARPTAHLSTGLHPVFQEILGQFFPALTPPQPTLCSAVNCEGEECGEAAIVQILPEGDDALCARHFRKVVGR